MSKKSTVCTNCEGTGNRNRSDADPSPMDCPHCDGTGLEDEGEVHDSDLLGKVNDLDTKLDTLQADMDIIKPWIAALYEDLNP